MEFADFGFVLEHHAGGVGIAQNRTERLPDFMSDRRAQFAGRSEPCRASQFTQSHSGFFFGDAPASTLPEQSRDSQRLQQHHSDGAQRDGKLQDGQEKTVNALADRARRRSAHCGISIRPVTAVGRWC